MRCDAKNALIDLQPIFAFKRSIYQDRLGTNIGKVEKRGVFTAGTPVIGTRWSGPAVFLTEENGYPLRTDGLVPNHDAERAAPDPVDGSERPHYWCGRNTPVF